MTQAKLRLAEVLDREETPEGKIKHLQYLRAQAEGRHSRAMEKKATSPVGSKSRDEGKASAAAEQDFIVRIDAEILRLNIGASEAMSEYREMVQEARALIEEGRHPWPMLLKALEVGDRPVAEAVAESGSSRFSAREKIAAAIKRTFPESPEEWRGRQEEAHEESTRQIAEALTR